MGKSKHTRTRRRETGQGHQSCMAECGENSGAHGNTEFRLGDPVVIVGLQSCDQYNGATGKVGAIDATLERIAVDICGSTGKHSTLRVRPTNLICIGQALEYSTEPFDIVDLLGIADLPGSSCEKAIKFATCLDANARFCWSARPWEVPHCSDEAVSIELKDHLGFPVRTMCAQLVGQSRVAFGVAFYQSYNHFAANYDHMKQKKSICIYVDLDSWGQSKGMRMLLVNRANAADAAELSIISAGLKFLPLFWRALRSTAYPPRPWLVPLGFEQLEQSYDLDTDTSLHSAGTRAVFRYPPVVVPVLRAEHPAMSIMRSAPMSCQSLHPPSCVSLSHVIAHHRMWLAEHPSDATHEAVTRKLALAYALSECRNEASHREAIDLCLAAVAMEPKGDDPNGARSMLLDFALTAGDHEAVLRGLSTFPRWHDPDVLWTSVLMWFCAHGATSKHTQRALNKAVTIAPDVFPLLVRDEMMPEKEGSGGYRTAPCSMSFMAGEMPYFGGSSSARYVENFGLHWQEAGAITFLHECGRPAYIAAKSGQILDGVSMPRPLDPNDASGNELHSSMCELRRCMRANVPSQGKVMCAFCRRLDHLKKCSRCLAVSYCSSACQSKDWKSGHKLVCEAAHETA